MGEELLEWALSGEETLPGDLTGTVRSGILDLRKNAPTLAKAFGVGAATLRESRDKHLRAAACELEDLPLARKAIELDKEIRRFSSGLWSRCKGDLKAPESFSKLQRALFLAMKTGLEMPGERQLTRILKTPYPSKR